MNGKPFSPQLDDFTDDPVTRALAGALAVGLPDGAERTDAQESPRGAEARRTRSRARVHAQAEQAVGFHATIEQHLALPFETVVLGAPVTAKKNEVTSAGGLVVI